MHKPDTIHLLTFHGLGVPKRSLPAGEQDYWLDPGFFRKILDRVSGLKDVAITFDDSNESDFEVALPALVERGMTASFFVVTDRIDKIGCLSTKQILTMAKSGMKIGSHGKAHRPWASLRPGELIPELAGSRATLEALLGQPVRSAACPYGSYNRRVLAALRRAGYEQVYTSDGGSARRNEWLSARNTIARRHTMEDVEATLSPPAAGAKALLRMLKRTIKRWR